MLFIIITYDLLPIKRQIIVHSNPLIEPVYTPNYYVVEPMLPSPRPIATATLPEKQSTVVPKTKEEDKGNVELGEDYML